MLRPHVLFVCPSLGLMLAGGGLLYRLIDISPRGVQESRAYLQTPTGERIVVPLSDLQPVTDGPGDRDVVVEGR